LDVGCGDGLFLSIAQSKDLECTGVDFSESALSALSLRNLSVRTVQADIMVTGLPFEDDTFDMVTALDVLEHVLEPAKLLRELSRVSRGSLVLSVPNFSSLPSRLQCLAGKVPENNRLKKGHVYWFNWRNLNQILNDNNLEIINWSCNFQAANIPLFGSLMAWLSRIMPNLFALSFVVLVQKKQ